MIRAFQCCGVEPGVGEYNIANLNLKLKEVIQYDDPRERSQVVFDDDIEANLDDDENAMPILDYNVLSGSSSDDEPLCKYLKGFSKQNHDVNSEDDSDFIGFE